MTLEPGDNNGRVTLAVLGEKMDNMQRLLQSHTDSDRIARKDQEDRLRVTEVQVVRLDQRLGIIAGVLGTLQVIAIGIATWLGLQG